MLHLATATPQTPTGLDSPDMGGHGIGLLEAFTPELREKMARLDKENQILRKRLERDVETMPSVPGSSEEDTLRRKVG